ncbi:queuosine precursor transporter [Oricola thermophila]|uniref:Probable queuosine precursor transporter n=1 Tax=Oricola thermophila TaxID=2742145 RepID=A0A6N1VGW0_9HYPH|nr:queuosine precursor transporter [Oricola thermophila]QKV20141.1 queuosine precursor transporter [Oricola thermophila]
MRDTRTFLPFIVAMCAVVAASNWLVQFPVRATFGGIDLADILTWGAFTYPAAFLVTDLTNRRFGPAAARGVVVAGFVLAVVLSVWLASPRIAVASGSAFLVAQMLDVAVFEKLRRQAWWKAPLVSSLFGSVIDTVLFFGIAFSARMAFIDAGFGMEDSSLAFPVPFLGIGVEVPLWVSLAAGDFCVKILVAVVLLAPYRVLRAFIADRSAVPA